MDEYKIEQLTHKPDPNPVWRNRLKWWWWLMPGYFIPWLFFAAWLGMVVIRVTAPPASPTPAADETPLRDDGGVAK
jgi:hypothetical protein